MEEPEDHPAQGLMIRFQVPQGGKHDHTALLLFDRVTLLQ